MMVFWETADQLPDRFREMYDRELQQASIEFAKSWQAPDKIVVSRSLTEAPSKRTRIVPSLSADDMRKLKAELTKPITVAGPTTASRFLNEGLVDEVSAYFLPMVVGGGLPMFQDITRTIKLEQIEERALKGGYIYRRYAVNN